MANQVTLTFAGDSQSLSGTVGDVDKGLKKVGQSSDEAADGFRRAGSAADEVDTKAMGFRDTMTGVQDTMGGVSKIAKGDLFNGFLTLGMGIGDLGSGFYNFLIPALEKTKLATLASAASSKLAAAGSRVWAAAQWVMNGALFASPITWIIVGIVALVAVIVLIATKTNWFSRAWAASWSWIKSTAQSAWNFIKQIPGWIGRAFSVVAGLITNPFRSAFNAIARAWNATVGRLSWTVPSWVPMIGGNSINVPHLPTYHTGGKVPGPASRETLALLRGGETINAPGSSGGAGGAVTVRAGDSLIGALLDQLAREVGRRGGDPSVLNIRIA